MSEALQGTADTVAPWTIKAVANETRETVKRLAAQEGVSVGTWLERRVREWADGFTTQPALPTALGKRVSDRSDPAEIVRLAMALAAVPAEQRDHPLIKSATATVRAELLDMRRPYSTPRLAPPAAHTPSTPPA